MNKSHTISETTSFVSIREARSCNVLSDATKSETIRNEVINIDALKALSRIVVAIQKRIDAGYPGGSKTAGANSSQNTNPGETKDR